MTTVSLAHTSSYTRLCVGSRAPDAPSLQDTALSCLVTYDRGVTWEYQTREQPRECWMGLCPFPLAALASELDWMEAHCATIDTLVWHAGMLQWASCGTPSLRDVMYAKTSDTLHPVA